MKTIALTKGLFAMVDDDDYDWLMKYKWCASQSYKGGCFYAISREEGKVISMHREVLKVMGKKEYVDHKDGNRLNNQKDNLRVCTQSQNTANRGKFKKNPVSKYKGICKVTTSSGRVHWYCAIRVNGKISYTKAESELDAAAKYNELAVKNFGEFASLNTLPITLPNTPKD